MFRLSGLILAAATAFPGLASAEGYLAQKPERLSDLVLGLGDSGYGVSQKDYALITVLFGLNESTADVVLKWNLGVEF